MKKIGLCCLMVAVTSMLFAQAPKVLEIEEAMKLKKIQTQIKGKGGYNGKCIRLGVKNVSYEPVTVAVEVGRVFVSDDTTVQDLIVTQPLMVSVKPGETQYAEVFTMCTQSFNAGPKKAENFSIGKMATGNLKQLASLIGAKKYLSSTAQCAVWAVANNDPIENIYGTDKQEMQDIATLLSELMHVPLANFNLTPKTHFITDINTSLEWISEKPLQNATLVLLNSQGQVVKTYFQNREYSAGFQQAVFGYYHAGSDSNAVFTAKLIENGAVIAQKTVQPSDTILNLQTFHTQTDFRFQVNDTLTASVGVYDAQGNVVQPIAQKMILPKGIHNKHFIIKKALPVDAYSIKIIATSGEILAEKMIDSLAKPSVHPIATLQKTITFTLKEEMREATLQIVNAKGAVVKTVFSNSKLVAGNKSYPIILKHVEGPAAKFKAQLLDAEGMLIWEGPVN